MMRKDFLKIAVGAAIVIAIIVVGFIIAMILKNPYVTLEADIGGGTNETIFFKATVKDGTAPFRYTFYFGDGSKPWSGTSNDGSKTISHKFMDQGNYNIAVTIVDESKKLAIDRDKVVIVNVPYMADRELEEGDFLYMDFVDDDNKIEPGIMNDHIAMYIGNNHFVHRNITSSEVEISKYAYFYSGKFRNLVFGYVTTSSKYQKENVSKWTQEQVGKTWFDSSARLIWKAYYSEGIDIDSNKSNNIVTVKEIINHNDTELHVRQGHEVPNYVKKGDIIFMDAKPGVVGTQWLRPGHSNDHSALYMGRDHRNGNYFRHASSGGVGNTTLERFSLWCENFTFWYVNNADESQRDGAIKFSDSQLGAPYQYFFGNPNKQCSLQDIEFGTKDNDPNGSYHTSHLWYCNELVWASYYNCNGEIGDGIDIDVNNWEERTPDLPHYPQIEEFIQRFITEGIFSFIYVDCNDIKESPNITKLFNISVEIKAPNGSKDLKGYANEPFLFKIEVKENRGINYNYNLYFGDGSPVIENATNSSVVYFNHSYSQSGTYTIVASVTDENGDVDSDAKIVQFRSHGI
jgi:uncharacterized protein YycO